MKKLFLCVIALFILSVNCYADGPGDVISSGNEGQSSVIFGNQYDFETKYTCTFNNGCIIEIPHNLQTANGVVMFSGFQAYDIGNKSYSTETPIVFFEYKGPTTNICDFFIKAYDINGVLVEQKSYQTGISEEYDFKKKRFKSKAERRDGYIKIPLTAVRVIVTEFGDYVEKQD